MEQKTSKMDKKGQVGLDTSKAVMLSLMFIGVVGFVVIILLGNLGNTAVASTSGSGVFSETVTSVAHTLRPLSFAGLDTCSATVGSAVNATAGGTIPATNYTVTGCSILFNTGQGNANGFNNTNWIINGTYTYNQFGTVESNISRGTTGFFSNTTTWFSLLGVVVIILIIGIVIFAVNRFGARDTGL